MQTLEKANAAAAAATTTTLLMSKTIYHFTSQFTNTNQSWRCTRLASNDDNNINNNKKTCETP